MLGVIFGFDGRIGRLAYLLSSLLVGVVLTVLTLAIVFGMMPHYLGPGGKAPDEIPAPVLLTAVLVVGLPWLWFTLTLQAKRMRDIGWRPLVVIPLWVGANVVDLLLAMLFGPAGGTATPFGALVNLAMACAMLFVPGRQGDDNWTPPSFGSTYPAHSPTPPPRPGRVRPAPRPEPTGFGRRVVP